MKQYLSFLLVALLLFAFLVSCSTSQNGNNANSSDSGVAQDSTNQSETNIDSSTTDSSTQNTDLPTDSIKSDLFKKAYERNKVDGIKYYTALEIGAINSDLYENENYRIIDTYNDLNHLFSNAGAIEESVFEENYVLVVSRCYSDSFDTVDMGFHSYNPLTNEITLDYIENPLVTKKDSRITVVDTLLIPRSVGKPFNESGKIKINHNTQNYYEAIAINYYLVENTYSIFLLKNYEDLELYAKERGIKEIETIPEDYYVLLIDIPLSFPVTLGFHSLEFENDSVSITLEYVSNNGEELEENPWEENFIYSFFLLIPKSDIFDNLENCDKLVINLKSNYYSWIGMIESND